MSKKLSEAESTTAPEQPEQNPTPVEPSASENAEDNGMPGNGEDAPSTQLNDSLSEMLNSNFIEYASYVIKDRAIPEIRDGLKPVQRRILHSLHEMDDGRFHKVANVIGHTMRYHPHGDASIGNALVVLANKEFFIEKQGNFGNIFTGDQASAPRYIECRLTPLAREVLFNKEITEYISSYDGRNLEPVTLPAKVPSLLMLGADGIAVGMSTHILPHNFNELLKAQIRILKGKDFKIYPDFFTGGIMDVGEYEDGNGRIKLRAKIDTVDDKTLVIREIPATTTTEALMSSIEEATRRGKIKIASINDYTTEKVEIEINLPRGIYAQETVKLLYAYTDCEVSISTSLCVIQDNRPALVSVSDILRHNTQQLLDCLRQELEIELGKLQERFHEKTLAQIFIENRIYKRIEECKTYEAVIQEVHKGLEPFRDQLRRDITNEDIEKLLQIQIRRISRFDINRNQEELAAILKAIDEAQQHLANLVSYAINYIQALLDKYGKNYPRHTTIADLEEINAREVALRNVKVGHDKVGCFVGSDVKNSNKSEEPLLCTEYDRLILLQNNGKFKVVPVPEKLYVGPVKYLFRADKSQIYSMIYRHRKSGRYYVKRFRIDSYIMNRTYSCIPKGCIIENIYTNYGVVVRADFKHAGGNQEYLDIDFDTVELRSKSARGFKLSDRDIASFTQIKRGSPNAAADEEEPPGNGQVPDGDGGGRNDAAEAAVAADEDTKELAEQVEPPQQASAPQTEDEPEAQPETAPAKAEKRQEKAAAKPAKQPRPKPAPEETPRRAPKTSRKSRPAKAKTAKDTSKDSAGKPASPRPKKKTAAPPPASAIDKTDSAPPNVADEWRQRSVKAAKMPRQQDSEKEQPAATADTGEQEASPAPAPKPKTKTAYSKPKPLRKVIDEETPFFLE